MRTQMAGSEVRKQERWTTGHGVETRELLARRTRAPPSKTPTREAPEGAARTEARATRGQDAGPAGRQGRGGHCGAGPSPLLVGSCLTRASLRRGLKGVGLLVQGGFQFV